VEAGAISHAGRRWLIFHRRLHCASSLAKLLDQHRPASSPAGNVTVKPPALQIAIAQ
jgi:hypothetical protein